MEKIKILYITNIPSPYMISLFDELSKYCELTVLFERERAKDRNAQWYNECDENKYKVAFLKGLKIGLEGSFSPSIMNWLNKDFDLYITGYCSPTGMIAFEYLKSKRKVFIFNADGGMIKKDNFLKFLIKKHFISSASYYLSSGKYTSEYLIHYGASKDNIYHYPFSSLQEKDIISELIPDELKKSLKEKIGCTKKFLLLSVGQFIYRKGYDVLLKACNLLESSIEVFIVGGEPTKEYTNIIRTNNIKNVQFIGFKSKKELADYYKAADVFVLPTREDIWGLVINEAMAHGLPCITTDKCVAGKELLVKSKSGYIVKSEDYQSIARYVNHLCTYETERHTMGNNALIHIRDYTIENIALKQFEAFFDIVNKQKGFKSW